MIALYRTGRSPLHRLPAGVKLAVLAVLAVVTTLVARTPLSAAIALIATVALFALGGSGPVTWARQAWQLRWIVLVLGASQWIFLGGAAAWTNTARVVAVVLLASIVTLTTRMGDMIDALVAALAPLRRVGVDPSRVAFTLSLAISAVPVIADLAQRIREAQRARGVRLGVRSVVTLLVLSLRHADDMADALTARGLA